MQKVYSKSKGLLPVSSGYCPGCMHSTAHKLIAEVLEEKNLLDDTILVLPVGCSILATNYFDFDLLCSLHGRAAANAVGLKHAQPDKIVLVYQGDGDASSIGLAESFYAANRGDPVTVIMINNQIYGMTGGQVSPCTLVGQISTTTPSGRDPQQIGYPVHMAEIIGALKAPHFVGRFALHTPRHILEAKKAIAKGIDIQQKQKGYSFIELLSACPTNWGVDSDKTPAYMEEKVISEFPLGIVKDLSGGDC